MHVHSLTSTKILSFVHTQCNWTDWKQNSLFPAACRETLFLLHVTCQSPIVRENWALSDINQNKHLGVVISFQVGCRQKCIFYFISERKFCRSTRTFWTPSRQPFNQFGSNLARVMPYISSTKPCLRILILVLILKLEPFFHRECWLIASPNFIC